MEIPEVIFDEEAHTYTQGGVTCPRSVTGLLKKYGLTADYSKIPLPILEMARARGVAYAEGRRLILKGYELDPKTIDSRIAGYLNGLQLFLRTVRLSMIETEKPFISPLGFGFRPDIICFLNGRRAVIDDKATFKIPKSVGPQTAGYKVGWNSLYPDQCIEDRYCLWLKKDGSMPVLKELRDPDDETSFMDVLDADIKLEAWRRKYGE